MTLGCLPPEQRALMLRRMLEPEQLLRALEAATQPGRPFVELIGIKSSPSEWQELREVHGPAFRDEVQSDPEIVPLLDELRALGFEFGWGGYSDCTGEEVTLHIKRNREAEERLRELVDHKMRGSGAE
jgi:hypothetical protein